MVWRGMSFRASFSPVILNLIQDLLLSAPWQAIPDQVRNDKRRTAMPTKKSGMTREGPL